MSTSRPRQRLYQPDEDGILLHESSSQNYEENRPSLQVYKTQIKIASFGTTTRSEKYANFPYISISHTFQENFISTEDLREYFECPVCFLVPRKPPIYACIRGHMICASCKVSSFSHLSRSISSINLSPKQLTSDYIKCIHFLLATHDKLSNMSSFIGWPTISVVFCRAITRRTSAYFLYLC